MSELFEKIPMEGVKNIIPLVIDVGEAAEHGKSIFSQNNKEVVSVFENFAGKLIG